VDEYELVIERVARELLIEVFNLNGILARKSTSKGIEIIWVKITKGKYAKMRLSFNRNFILGQKGVETIHLGIIPMYIDRRELEASFLQKNDKKMVKKILLLMKKIIKSFSLDVFEEPYNWSKL